MPSDRRGPSRPMQAFKVDPGWYDRHWLEEAPARPPGAAARLLALALAGAGRLWRGRRRIAWRPLVPRPGPAGAALTPRAIPPAA